MGFPAETRGHAREALRLDEVVEGERREHGAVAVNIGFDEEGGAADAVEVDFAARVAVDICGVYVLVGSFVRQKKIERKKKRVSLLSLGGEPLAFFVPKWHGFSMEEKEYVPAI